MGALGINLTVGATLVDQLAWLISRAIHFSIEIAGYVKTIIAAIFRFLGRVVSSTVSITTEFLRWVLNLLFTNLSTLAVNALHL